MQTQLASLKGVDIERVSIIPVAFLKTSLEDEQNDGRGAALLLTKEDILTIKRYERYGLSLPREGTEVQQRLGIKDSGIPGLEPKDIAHTFNAVYLHAQSWDNLEKSIKDAGFKLDIFADDFIGNGATVIQIIEKMGILEQIDMTIAELNDEAIDKLTPTPLSETNLRITSSLANFIGNIGHSIAAHQEAAERLTKDIENFTSTLQNSLIPQAHHKITLVKNNNLEQHIKDLSRDIERLTADIEQKNQEYSTTKKNIAWGIFGGVVGLAITGGIFGSRAEKIRKEKDRLVREKDEKVRELKTKEPVSAAIRSLDLQFQDLYIRLADALESAGHLRDLWALMGSYIESSTAALRVISDDRTLLEFIIQFQRVIKPWHDIKGFTERLLRIFDSALEQFQLESK